MLHDESDEDGSKRAAQANAEQVEAAAEPSTSATHPASDDLCVAGGTGRLANTDEESNQGNRVSDAEPASHGKTRCDRGGGGQSRPPQDGGNQNLPWPKAVGQVSAWNLREGVPEKEGTQNPTHRFQRKGEFILNKVACDTEVEAVQIGQDRSDRHQCHHLPAH